MKEVKLLDLSDEQKKKIEKRIRKEIARWKNDTSERQAKLQRWNDLVEGIVEETDYPFEGAANVHIQVVGIYMSVYHSICSRSVLGADRIWYIESDDEEILDKLPMIEDNLNYKARSVWNITEGLRDVFWTTFRDGLGALQVPQVEEEEKNVHDTVFISNEAEFLEEFPAEDMQMPEKDWQDYREKSKSATDETPLEVDVTYDKIIYSGPKAELVEFADLVTFPASAKGIEKEYARGYGKRFYVRRGTIREKRENEEWYEGACNNILAKTKKGSQVTAYVASKDQAEGVSRQNSDDYEFFEIVYRVILEKNKPERKLLITYSYEHKEIVACLDYPYRVDFYALFRYKRKPGRLPGYSIPEEVEELNEIIDTLYNQRINSRKIVEVPSFKAKKSAAKDFDPEAEENRWHPGVVFWLDDPNAFTQMANQPVDMRGSMEEESNTLQYLSLLMGVRPDLFSGSPAKENPGAPGNKTGLLIQQSNMRMDDPLSELRYGVEKVGEICLSHEYQFGAANIQFMSQDQNSKTVSQSFPKSLLRKPMRVKAHGLTVLMNPDYELKKWLGYSQAFAQYPMIGQRNESLWYLLRNALRGGRVQDRDKILPSLEALQQEQIQNMAKAMIVKEQMQKQQQMQMIQKKVQDQQKAVKAKRDQAMGALQDHVKKRALDLKMAEQQKKAQELALNGQE